MANLRFGALLAVLAYFTIQTTAQNSTNAPAATFYLDKTETQFSVNVANNSNDIFITFISPAYSWVGFGFGKEMKNSLMFIMYPNTNGDNATLSPRTASGNSEPTYDPSIKLEVLPGTTIDNTSMTILHAVCHNCRTWSGGSIDLKSTSQPMIYAFGPGDVLQSNSLSADLRRHARYGFFSMDMLAATGPGGVPPKISVINGVSMRSPIIKDHDRASLAHAILGCVALFVLWPINVVLAGFIKNIRIHIGCSVLIIIFLIISYSLGISKSFEYNRSKTFSSPHQILSFLSLVPTLALCILPIPTLSRIHASIPRLHTPLATASFLMLVVTGGLGLSLARQIPAFILAYSGVALVVCVFSGSLALCIRRRGTARQRAAKGQRQEDDGRAKWFQMQEGSGEFGKDGQVVQQWGWQQGQVPQGHGQWAQGQQQQQQQVRVTVNGGGTMPGPQYLLNMHPGVPVHRW